MITVYTHTGSGLLAIEKTAELYYFTCSLELQSDAAAIDRVPQIDTALTWPLCNIRTETKAANQISTHV